MKHFTFIDKDLFFYTQKEIWDTVLNVAQWPQLWKHVIDLNIQTQGEVTQGSKIDCYFTLFHLMHLHFDILITTLKEEEFASFEIRGHFSGQGRWILKPKDGLTAATLYLHLQTHHFFLKFISKLPFGRQLVQYSHRRVMIEGKKMILKKLSDV